MIEQYNLLEKYGNKIDKLLNESSSIEKFGNEYEDINKRALDIEKNILMSVKKSICITSNRLIEYFSSYNNVTLEPLLMDKLIIDINKNIVTEIKPGHIIIILKRISHLLKQKSM